MSQSNTIVTSLTSVSVFLTLVQIKHVLAYQLPASSAGFGTGLALGIKCGWVSGIGI